MDIIINVIFLILIIGIILMVINFKNIKKYKEGFKWPAPNGPLSSGGTGDELDPGLLEDIEDEANLEVVKEGDYEVVGKTAPPKFRDSIYDHNLRDALKVWRETGCDVTSKYAPSIDNKDNLFGDVGWARDDYPFRVKSMYIEANKAEFNYYDWGHYEDGDGKSEKDNETNDTEELNKDKINEWKFNELMDGRENNIKRPNLVKYPLGIRKAKALCYDNDPGKYQMPKKGDRVKIKKRKNYDGPYFSGIVMTEEGGLNENVEVGGLNENVEVFWEQKGEAEYDAVKNSIKNNFTREKCGVSSIKESKGCTRDETKGTDAEIILPDEPFPGNQSLSYKLFGRRNENNGQQDWFGWPTITEDDKGDPEWKERYIYGRKNDIPEQLLTFDSNAGTNMINSNDGSVKAKQLFIVEQCKENSACEDLRCDTRANKMRKKYPLTRVCDKDERNNVEDGRDSTNNSIKGTNHLICSSGAHRGAKFTYYDQKTLCTDQDYRQETNCTNCIRPANSCNEHCENPEANCKYVSEYQSTTYTKNKIYAEVFSQPNYKGHKAIILGTDQTRYPSNLFPALSGGKIKSFKLYGGSSVRAFINRKEFKSGNVPSDITVTAMKVVIKLEDKKSSKTGSHTHFTNSDAGKPYEIIELDVPKKLSAIQFTNLFGGDQNWGNETGFLIKLRFEDDSEESFNIDNPGTGSKSHPGGRLSWDEEHNGNADDADKFGIGRQMKEYGRDPPLSAINNSARYSELVDEIEDTKRHRDNVEIAALVAMAVIWTWVISIALWITYAILNGEVKRLQKELNNEAKGDSSEWIDENILSTGKNMHYIMDTRIVKAIEIYPSYIGSGHEGYYKGFNNLELWTNETAE